MFVVLLLWHHPSTLQCCQRSLEHSLYSAMEAYYRPDSLFFLPEYHGAVINFLSSVEPSEIECVSQQISVKQGSDEYQEYFDYVCEGLSIGAPTTWKEAFQQYEKFTHIAENGFSP